MTVQGRVGAEAKALDRGGRLELRGVRALYSERTVMVSDKETSIDGDKVLLG